MVAVAKENFVVTANLTGGLCVSGHCMDDVAPFPRALLLASRVRSRLFFRSGHAFCSDSFATIDQEGGHCDTSLSADQMGILCSVGQKNPFPPKVYSADVLVLRERFFVKKETF
jgi:hypothetical protein